MALYEIWNDLDWNKNDPDQDCLKIEISKKYYG